MDDFGFTPPPLGPERSGGQEHRRFHVRNLRFDALNVLLGSLGLLVAIGAWIYPVAPKTKDEVPVTTPAEVPDITPQTSNPPGTPIPELGPTEIPVPSTPAPEVRGTETPPMQKTVPPKAPVKSRKSASEKQEPGSEPTPSPDSMPFPKQSESDPPFISAESSETPTPTPDEDVDEDPDGDPPGETITVMTVPYVTPHGARPRGSLSYPPVPADALRSRLSSEEISCQVDVGVDGVAVADCGGNAPDLPEFLLARAKEILEATPWQPAIDDSGKPCSDRVTVVFRWK